MIDENDFDAFVSSTLYRFCLEHFIVIIVYNYIKNNI